MTQLCSVSIDVDGLDCYRAIHGLAAVAGEDPIFTKAMPRFVEAMARTGRAGTLFVVGHDLARPEAASMAAAAAEAGHEIANHSYAHDYALSRRPPAAIEADLGRAADAIEAVSGARPRGFRAPGYNLSEALLDAVEATGHRYDSSLFPTPAYFGARAAAIAGYQLRSKLGRGRPSDSLVGDPREFAAPRHPFRPRRDARFRPAGEGPARDLVEVPMSVATRFRIPWLGTTLAMFPDRIGRGLTRAALSAAGPTVLELHAIDFLGAEDLEGLPDAAPLIAAQADLRVPLSDKLRRLGGAIEQLDRGGNLVCLEEVAAAYR